MKNLVRLISALAVVCVAIVVPAASASAHTATLTSSQVCQSDGTYKVTFTGRTSDVPTSGPGHTATLDISGVLPAGAAVSGAPSTVVGNTTYTFSMVVPGTTKNVQATANLTWGDGTTASPTRKVGLYADCKTPVTAVEWTATPPTCEADGKLVPSPQPEGIVAMQSPEGTGPGTYTITFVADPGYVNNGPGSQTIVVKPQLTTEQYCLIVVTPVSPTITVSTCTGPGQSSEPSFTLPPNGGGITYSAVGNVVTASAGAAYKFVTLPEGWTLVNQRKATFTVTYPDPGECLVVIQYEAPTPRDLCDSPPTWNDFPAVLHAIFSILPNGDAVLTAAAGYTFASGTSITFELPEDTYNKCPVTPVAPAVTQSTCVDGTGTTPTVTPAVTEHLSYVVADDLTSVTATPGVGFEIVLEGTTGWVLNEDGTATYAVTLETPECDIPVVPSVTTNDDCYTALDTVTLSEGVGYTGVDNNDGTATFTAEAGYYFDDDGEHVTTIVLTYTPNTDEQCDLIPGDIAAECVSAVPYLAYAVDLPPGFETDDATPMTITFVNPDGEDYVKANLPIKGKILWPGAKATEPQQWPGWEQLPDGSYVETTGNFAWTRPSVTVLFDVNPHYEVTVNYPPESSKCANPPSKDTPPGDKPPAETPPANTPTAYTPPEAPLSPVLADTGVSTSMMLLGALGFVLVLGGGSATVAGLKRRD